MSSFVVDPHLFTVPNDTEPATEIRAWMEALESWALYWKDSPYDWRHIGACTDKLHVNQRFPDIATLRRLSARVQADVNIRNLIHAIRMLTIPENDVRSRTSVRYVVPSDDCATVPSEVLDRNLPELRSDITTALLCVACESRVNQGSAFAPHWVTRRLICNNCHLMIRAPIGAAEPSHLEGLVVDGEIEGRWHCLFAPDDVANVLDWREVLSQGPELFLTTVESIARTHREGVRRQAQFAPGFLSSLQIPSFRTDPVAVTRFMKVCAALLAGAEAMLDEPPYDKRENKSGNASGERRSADRAKHMRVRITKEGVGWRLHYWRITPGHSGGEDAIEFERLLKHSDDID